MFGFVQPVPKLGSRLPVVSDGMHMRSSGKMHEGIDIMYKRLPSDPGGLPWSSTGFHVPPGTPALAAGAGVVLKSANDSHGGYVYIDHGDGVQTNYRHLNPRKVNVGDRVNAGDIVGLIGDDPANAGDPAHLHFELVINGSKVDPQSYFNSWPAITAKNTLLFAGLVAGGIYIVYKLMVEA